MADDHEVKIVPTGAGNLPPALMLVIKAVREGQ